ncbi:MAG: nuclear transport factor 2 family protein [Gemmatimonadota bacterium]|nr:MAG: nuclear transport factor 2 family protein [Gemmatimonadota bacterium]
MMRRLILAALAVALVATSCQPAASELSEAERTAIAETVNAINAGFWDAWRAADFDRGMSYYDNSPDLAFAFEGAVDYGYAEIEAKYLPGMAGVASQEITVTDSRTTVLAPDVVCIMEAGSSSATDTAGVTGPEGSFAVTSIWVLRDGEWKIHIGHESFPSPESIQPRSP